MRTGERQTNQRVVRMAARMASMATGLLACGVGAAGCAHDEGLVPAPQATVVPGERRLAYDQEGDVSVWVDGDAWRGRPRDLEEVMTPIWLTLQNHGQKPVRVMYRDLNLEVPSGMRMTPLPPFSMRTEGPLRTRAITVPAFRHHGFFIAPRYRPYYPGLRAWHSPLVYDPFFYDTYYARWRIPLPTEDMLQSALPEGVLDPGGTVSGFVYFPEIPKNARGTFTFRANLSEAAEGAMVASLDVPFVRK
jgi:hypothetical protein